MSATASTVAWLRRWSLFELRWCGGLQFKKFGTKTIQNYVLLAVIYTTSWRVWLKIYDNELFNYECTAASSVVSTSLYCWRLRVTFFTARRMQPPKALLLHIDSFPTYAGERRTASTNRPATRTLNASSCSLFGFCHFFF